MKDQENIKSVKIETSKKVLGGGIGHRIGPEERFDSPPWLSEASLDRMEMMKVIFPTLFPDDLEREEGERARQAVPNIVSCRTEDGDILVPDRKLKVD